jgi:hypothetical protein
MDLRDPIMDILEWPPDADTPVLCQDEFPTVP